MHTKETILNKISDRGKYSKYEYSEEADRLAHLFLQMSGVTFREGKKEHILKSWVDSIVKLHRIDGEDYSDIKKVIEWVTNDPFWRTNCLSPAKLRRLNKDGIKYFDVFAYKMNPPKSEAPIRPSEALI